MIDIRRIRKDFRSEVGKKMNLTNLQRAVSSPDVKKIHSVIIDSYHTTKVVQPVANDKFMLQVIKKPIIFWEDLWVFCSRLPM